jgi:predicted amidohydrolase
MTISRRSVVLAGAAATLVAPAGAEIARGESEDRARLVLIQHAWTGDTEAGSLRALLDSGCAGLPRDLPILAVLPLARAGRATAKADAFYARVGQAAQASGVYLAGAAIVRPNEGPARTEAFLFDPAGHVLLRAPKIMPDVLTGFDDTAAAGAPADFAVARVPFGCIGLLPGEDVFRPSHLRALCFAGAEIVINCAREAADAALPARRDVMTALAYWNMAYVVTVTEAAPSRTGLWDWAGMTVAAADAEVTTAVIDTERLRRARLAGGENVAYASRTLPPMVRDGLYGPAFTAAAAGRTPAKAATRAAWTQEAERRIAAQARRATPANRLLPAYDAVLVQTPHRPVAGAPDRKAAVAQNIRDFLAIAAPHAARPMTKLVMFGEFAFTAAGYRTIPDALSVALTWPGPELAQLATFATEHHCYVAAQQLEHDPKFPGRIFNTAFLFDDTGRLASRHRKLQCVDLLGTLPDTTPGSIYDAYVAAYGADSLWQVVDTPLGKLAPMICFENMFPEVAQIYVQQGAEVYLHLTSEGWDPITETRYAWNAGRRFHAMAASAYFLSVNEGDDPVLRDPYHVIGESQAIDPYGRVIGMLSESRPGVLVARIERAVLAGVRADVRANLAIWDEPGVYAHAYGRGRAVANNLWADVPANEFPYRDLVAYRDTLRRFVATGVYTPPRAAGG